MVHIHSKQNRRAQNHVEFVKVSSFAVFWKYINVEHTLKLDIITIQIQFSTDSSRSIQRILTVPPTTTTTSTTASTKRGKTR